MPIYELRNDGRDNLLGALLIAGQFVIPEVHSWRVKLSDMTLFNNLKHIIWGIAGNQQFKLLDECLNAVNLVCMMMIFLKKHLAPQRV